MYHSSCRNQYQENRPRGLTWHSYTNYSYTRLFLEFGFKIDSTTCNRVGRAEQVYIVLIRLLELLNSKGTEELGCVRLYCPSVIEKSKEAAIEGLRF